jgi:hypothetical protein
MQRAPTAEIDLENVPLSSMNMCIPDLQNTRYSHSVVISLIAAEPIARHKKVY